MNQKATIGRIVIYRTDGRNGLYYDLPAIINCTQETHPGDYPNGEKNPLPVPESETHVHLTVFTPGGFGTALVDASGDWKNPTSVEFVGAQEMKPGSGTYVEWNVPFNDDAPRDQEMPLARSWRWPVIVR